MTIENLEPKRVWKHFYSLTRIPRPSKREQKAVEYMYEWGKSLGLETIKDEVGNMKDIVAEIVPTYKRKIEV